jgi:2-succinyl-5-enolpyruvyl-6-hydroxy-3-cyclohexene-1-carboxylate synthase
MGNVQQNTALFVAAFFDELTRWGVQSVVVSPGSRSTALALAAYELSQRCPEKLKLMVDIDERGAAFLALGMAKASGKPVVCIATSGTAPAHYYPAVIEASTSRVPLIVLSGDRPLTLQGLGAPQTTDQLNLFGNHVRAFREMPLPGARGCDIAFARQAAREACLAALGKGAAWAGTPTSHDDLPLNFDPAVQVASRGCAAYAGPVHLNFPFEEPLMPDFLGADLQAVQRGAKDCFAAGRRDVSALKTNKVPVEPLVSPEGTLTNASLASLEQLLWKRRALVVAGEGTCETLGEAEEIVAWARALSLPVLADPLSGLRSVDDPLVIDNYDNLCRGASVRPPEVVVRFGRYPVSKAACTLLQQAAPLSIVVDSAETRDYLYLTDMFVATTPLAFVRSPWHSEGRKIQKKFAEEWVAANDEARLTILKVEQDGETEGPLEGSYVRALLEMIPEASCLFSANSMSIRALDTFYVKDGKPFALLANRGQNGIDGVVSSAVGAAQHFKQTTLLTGDFTFLHDLNGLALQRELLMQQAVHEWHTEGGQGKGPGSAENLGSESVTSSEGGPSLVIVLLNNNGGAIFDMLPQASDEWYFDRLFLAPQDVHFAEAAAAFNIPSACVQSVAAFRAAYQRFLGTPGISLIEITLPLRGVSNRYRAYQK